MTYRVISAATETLANRLTTHLRTDPVLGTFFDSSLGGTMEVLARTPQEMAEADDTGLSVWLYRIARDPELLNHAPKRVSFDQFEKPPLPLRLHYLMTPIVNEEATLGNDPGLEQFIIGKVLQTFHDHPRLEGADLQADLTGTGQTLGVRLEPLGLEEITRVWDALETAYQLCISYEVSVALIASDKEPALLTPVDVVESEIGTASEGAGP